MMHRLNHCTVKCILRCNLQAKVDISAFDRAAGAYKTPKTRLLQYSLCEVEFTLQLSIYNISREPACCDKGSK